MNESDLEHSDHNNIVKEAPNATPSEQSKKKKKKRINFSYVWLVPLLATLGVCWLIYDAISNRGQLIDIEFQNAQGLQAGRTQVRYQGIEMGKVESIVLSDDFNKIDVKVRIQPHAVKLLRSDTQFWLVQPKATLTEISGLDTLISGNYISVLPGSSSQMSKNFVALTSAPIIKVSGKSTQDSLSIILESKALDSIQVGAKLLYKKVEVGEVLSYRMENDKIIINAVIDTRYRNLVKKESRFWNISGISARIGFNGLQVQMANLASILQGGLAFDSPDESPPAEDGAVFNLYVDAVDAERTLSITIDLPLNSNSIKSGTPIVYEGVKIGELNGADFNEDRTKMVAQARILPSFSDLLTEHSSFLIETFDASELKNISNLILGNYLSLSFRPGKPETSFVARTLAEQREEDPNNLKLTLISEQSSGLKVGSNIAYKGVIVGYVTSIELNDRYVAFKVAILQEYRHLVRSNSSFYIDGGIQSQINAQGVDVNIPSMDRLLQSGISFTSEGDERTEEEKYILYESQMSAQLADKNALGSTEYQLITDVMPSVSEQTPILYKNMRVGKVKSFKMDKSKIYITISINNQYVNLINDKTVFWNYSGVQLDASLSGINFQMGPLTSLISGSIAFDTIQDIPNKIGKDWRLYSSLSEAQKMGRNIYFDAKESMGLNKGSKIKFNGIDVGEVTQLLPDFKNKKVKIEAVLYTKYAKTLASRSSHFWVVTPQIGLDGIKNTDALFASYISVNMDPSVSTKFQTNFSLDQKPLIQSGLSIVLEAKAKQGINIGTPLLYRELEVGDVIDIQLGSLSDRVLFFINVDEKYAYLIRENTIFWNMSGVNLDVSLLKGASLKTGTVDSLVRGGIAFATPEPKDNNPLQAKASKGKRFFLNSEVNPDWLKWQTMIPK